MVIILGHLEHLKKIFLEMNLDDFDVNGIYKKIKVKTTCGYFIAVLTHPAVPSQPVLR